MTLHWYKAYGLTFASDLRLPELDETGPGPVDVRITIDRVPASLDDPVAEGPRWTASERQWLLTVDGVGRFHVAEGSRIAIEPWGSEKEVRAFLFGTTLGALLHQRRLLTLHASSFLESGRAVLVAGNSGAGKSTSLAALIDRGFRMITDDKTVLFLDGDRLVTIPGHPTVRLWRDALEAAGRPHDGLPRLRDDLSKYLWRAPEIHDAAVEVGALYLLGVGDVDEVSVTRLHGQAAFRAVLGATYRRGMMKGMGVQETHFVLAARLADQVPIHRITRPQESQTVADVVDAVLAGATGQES